MTEKPSVLYSEYIIDGMPRALTPARMLEECSSGPAGHAPARKPEPIIDETLDLAPSTYKFDPARIDYTVDNDSTPEALQLKIRQLICKLI